LLNKLINSKASFYALFVFTFLIFASIYISSYQQKSATFDEAVIIYSGSNFLHNGETRVNAENPLLAKSLLAFPTIFMDIDIPKTPKKEQFSYQMGTGFTLSQKFLYSDNDASTILFWSRLVNVILCFSCAIFLYLFLRIFLKHKLAFIGMLIFLLSPSVSANARLATVDIAVMLFIFGSTYFLFKALLSGKTSWAVFAGIMTAGAMLSKFTGILLIPIILVQLVIYCLQKNNKEARLNALKFFAVIIITSLLLINLCYLFKGVGYSLNDCDIRSPLLTKLASVPLLSDIPIPLPLSYVKGFDIVAFNNQPGFPNIFMGKYYNNGGSWWYYYLVVSFIKIPIPFLLLIVSGIIIASRRFYRRWEYYFILIPPLAIFLNFSFVAYRQLGIRYILPLFPFLAIAALLAVRYALRFKHGKLRVLVVLLLAWMLVSNFLIYPHYLAYFNSFAGGAEGGKNWLASSNLDWGQDLPGLKNWLNKKGNPPMYMFYFGQGDPEYYGIKYSGKPKYIAISVSYMYLYKSNKALPPRIRQYLERILQTEPVDNIGYSIYIYKALQAK